MGDFHQVPAQLGDYYLIRLLGQSASTKVFVGEHAHNHKQVAIKLLYEPGTDGAGQEFLAHTTRLTQLRHPHIVPILDFGIKNDTAFLVMNYVAGGSLRQRYPRGTRMPLTAVLFYVQQVASALQYVHERGLVHRDVKPHNMLLDANGMVMLSDFGTAVPSYSLASSHTYDFEGTVLYAAPEQLQGKAQRSSDQYALGAVIYEWISGDWLFSGTFHEVAHQHLFVTPPPFIEKAVQCPPDIEKVILRSLEKIPEKRFASVKAFADELEWAYKVAQAKRQLPDF